MIIRRVVVVVSAVGRWCSVIRGVVAGLCRCGVVLVTVDDLTSLRALLTELCVVQRGRGQLVLHHHRLVYVNVTGVVIIDRCQQLCGTGCDCVAELGVVVLRCRPVVEIGRKAIVEMRVLVPRLVVRTVVVVAPA